MFWLTIVVAMMGCFGISAQACTPAYNPFDGMFDRRARVLPDCTFTDAGDREYPVGTGEAPKDMGGGRVVQKMTFGHVCYEFEQLTVVDCQTLEMIQIRGVPNPDGDGMGIETTVRHLQPPYGPIRLRKDTTVASLADVAEKNKLTYEVGAEDFIAHFKGRNRVNPYCGCKLFYPDSEGAKK